MKKLISILVAFAMTAALCVCMAFAADPVPATEAQQADTFKLSKTLKMPEGTKTPASTFVFNITPYGDNHMDNEPTYAPQSISFSANEATTAVDGYVYVTKDLEAGNIFANLTTPGVYSYLIVEDADASTEAGENEKYTYAVNQFIVNIYVDKDGDQTITIQEKEDPQDEPSKLDAEEVEEQDPDGEEGDTITVKYAHAQFENTYVKTAATTPDGKEDIDDPTDPDDTKDDTAFALEKKVTNDAAGLFDDNDFDFTVNVAAPSINTLDENKTGYSYSVVKIGSNPLQTIRTGMVTPGTPATITLKTGERAVFTDLDVGAKVTVTEASYADFAQTANLNGTDKGAATTAIETPVVQDAEADLEVINESNNNTTPTGILISNLPYIALALVAIGGLCAYVIVRRKNEDNA